ncbi:hypothetical protein [Hyphomicrobium sp.]|uniref:hypothetical protein n=1 Tax=Hyphomicrobium sp. TaxID=82 RepID=UPI002BF49545|nr:hypothetical protein [Hyphomicrobium sp.]HRN89090.1 hypothetical protein [Hyphomicrobium sp.]HRQ26872.1 hypothetical protein [Hyphomicrobium sp.]
MPQVIALVVIGAGLYAGYKWVSRTIAKGQRRGERRVTPKDLGTLEYDAKSGVYRPRGK